MSHRQGLHSDDRPYEGEELCYCDEKRPNTDTLDEQIDYLLVSLYVGETFMQDNPNWRKQMDNPKLQATATKLKALFTEHSKQARIEFPRWIEENCAYSIHDLAPHHNAYTVYVDDVTEFINRFSKRNKGEDNE